MRVYKVRSLVDVDLAGFVEEPSTTIELQIHGGQEAVTQFIAIVDAKFWTILMPNLVTVECTQQYSKQWTQQLT